MTPGASESAQGSGERQGWAERDWQEEQGRDWGGEEADGGQEREG